MCRGQLFEKLDHNYLKIIKYIQSCLFAANKGESIESTDMIQTKDKSGQLTVMSKQRRIGTIDCLQQSRDQLEKRLFAIIKGEFKFSCILAE